MGNDENSSVRVNSRRALGGTPLKSSRKKKSKMATAATTGTQQLQRRFSEEGEYDHEAEEVLKGEEHDALLAEREDEVEEEEEENYYDMLNVEPTASQAEIKDAFKKVAKRYHPDRCKVEGAAVIFSRCSQAYEVLSDPVSRGLYDVMLGFKQQSPEEARRINAMNKQEAMKAIELMEETVTTIRQQEQAKNGLIILEAIYGDLQSDSGNRINVTVPLQCLVDDSYLVIHEGQSKCWLQGFYDPSLGSDKQLRVRYRFLGHLHECIVDDDEALCVPLEEHLVQDDDDDALDTIDERNEPENKGRDDAVRAALALEKQHREKAARRKARRRSAAALLEQRRALVAQLESDDEEVDGDLLMDSDEDYLDDEDEDEIEGGDGSSSSRRAKMDKSTLELLRAAGYTTSDDEGAGFDSCDDELDTEVARRKQKELVRIVTKRQLALAKREEKKKARRTKARRRFFLYATIIAVVGYFLVRDTDQYKAVKTKAGAFTAPLMYKLFGGKGEQAGAAAEGMKKAVLKD